MRAPDAGPGRSPWMQALDASPGRRPWVQELDAGPGCRPWMQALDTGPYAGPGCPFPSPVKVPHPPATVKNKFAVVGWGEAACPGSLSPRRGASPRWGGRAWEAYRPGKGRAFPPTGSVAPRVGVHPQEAKSAAGGKGPPLRRVTYFYPPCVWECHFGPTCHAPTVRGPTWKGTCRTPQNPGVTFDLLFSYLFVTFLPKVTRK